MHEITENWTARRDDSKAVPSTSAHGTSTQRIKVDKSSFLKIYSTLGNCKFHFFSLKEGTYNYPVAFADNYVTHSYSIKGYDVVKFLMKRIKAKCSPEMHSLFDLCMRVLQDNIDAIDYVGGIPFDILKPVLEKCTAKQLYDLEVYNPHFLEDSDYLWKLHCEREFRGQKPGNMETWRELYLCYSSQDRELNIHLQYQDRNLYALKLYKFSYERKFDEREEKTRSYKANISKQMAKATPGKNIEVGDETEEEDQIDIDSVKFEELLARLNSCLEDKNLDDIEKLTNGNQLLKVSEDRLIVGIGKHLIRKLTGNACTNTSKIEKICPCVDSSEDKKKEHEQEPKEKPDTSKRKYEVPTTEPSGANEPGSSKRKREEPTDEFSIKQKPGSSKRNRGKRKTSCRERKLEPGEMYIGSADAWHGELDLLASGEGITPVKAVPCYEVDTGADDNVDGDSPDSHREITNLELKVQNLETSISQPIQQAITFAWTEYNRHPDLSPLYPTVFMNNFEFSFIVYNPVTDSLLAPINFMKLVNCGMEKNDVNRYLGIFVLWLILNHRFFFVKHLKVEEQHPCDFRAKAKDVIEIYKELNKFSRHISCRSKGLFGHINLTRKRKRESATS